VLIIHIVYVDSVCEHLCARVTYECTAERVRQEALEHCPAFLVDCRRVGDELACTDEQAPQLDTVRLEIHYFGQNCPDLGDILTDYYTYNCRNSMVGSEKRPLSTLYR
jgi:hypothetical protein